MEAIINGKPCTVNLEYRIELLKASWAVWGCNIEFDDGSFMTGSIQGNEHMIAPETFEED